MSPVYFIVLSLVEAFQDIFIPPNESCKTQSHFIFDSGTVTYKLNTRSSVNVSHHSHYEGQQSRKSSWIYHRKNNTIQVGRDIWRFPVQPPAQSGCPERMPRAFRPGCLWLCFEKIQIRRQHSLLEQLAPLPSCPYIQSKPPFFHLMPLTDSLILHLNRNNPMQCYRLGEE